MAVILREYIGESRARLRRLLLDLLPRAGSVATAIQGLSLHRFDHAGKPRMEICSPMLAVVVQGKKWVRTGGEELYYGGRRCFVAGTCMPATCRVCEATPDAPHLALTLALDHALLARLAPAASLTPGVRIHPGARVHAVDDAMLDALVRLVRLLALPAQLPFLSPLFRQEIHYRLLTGPFGGQLREHHGRRTPWDNGGPARCRGVFYDT